MGHSRGSRFFPHFTCHEVIDLKIHWVFFKLHCNIVIIWQPECETHWSWTSDHCILEAPVLKTGMKINST